MKMFKSTLTLLTVSAFLATGCAQLQSVPLTKSEQGVARPAVNSGDHVVVTTRDGVEHKFQVTAVEAAALRGEHDLIAYADMQSLGVQKDGMKISKTALIVGAVVLGAAAIGAASGGGSGGGY